MKGCLLCLALASILGAEVTQSVIPQMEGLHRGEGIVPEKYASEQFDDMRKVLGRRDDAVRVMSYNMLFNIKEDKLPLKHRWPERKHRLLEYIEYASPDVICSQELYRDQMIDLMKEIGFEYAFHGVGQADGKRVGEMNGIFYRKDRFNKIQDEVLFMSTDSDRVSTQPLSNKDRTLTMVILRDHRTGKDVAVFDVHFDFGLSDSRVSQAHFIADYVEPLTKKVPVVMCGDFNLFPNRPDLAKLPHYDGDYVHNILTSGSLRDTRGRGVLGHVGPIATFTNKSEDDVTPFEGEGEPGIILDRIYLAGDATVAVTAIDPARVNGEFPSDHMPVIIDLLLTP
jgi:endonuclease/exonuclease/phosphatase family metal-dependent hydrolase